MLKTSLTRLSLNITLRLYGGGRFANEPSDPRVEDDYSEKDRTLHTSPNTMFSELSLVYDISVLCLR